VDRQLKIAFDAKRLFHNGEGLGAYARTVVSDLQHFFPQHQYFLCTPSVTNSAFSAGFLDGNKYNIISPSKTGLAGSLWRSSGIVKDLKQRKIDVYFGLSNELPGGIDKSSIASLVTIHDVLFKAFPQQFSWIDRQVYQRKFTQAIATADMVLATSKYTERDIRHYFSTSKEIEVVYQSIVPELRNSARTAKRNHFLVVGTINERKNLALVIEAYRQLPKESRRPVKVVGEGKSYKAQMLARIQEYKLEPYFEFLGRVSDEKLSELYSASYALIFPTKYEGFGRPVIEALSHGTPVLTGLNSSLPEVVSKYGIIIEYDRPETLTEAMRAMASESKRSALMNGVKGHLAQFAPELVSQKLMNCIEKAVARR